MLKTDRIHREWSLENIFGDGQWCPFCHGEEFIHVEGDGIYCTECSAEFGVRMTAGDAGVVVDAFSGESNYTIRHRGFVLDNVVMSRGSSACWQVLKECEEGLNDRAHWLTHLNRGDERGFLYHTRDADPLGERVYFFAVYDVARQLARDRWNEHTKAGKEAARLRAEGVYQYQWPTWINDHQRKYLREWESKYREQIEGYELDEGYYFADQCGRVFDDCFHVHRCLPKPGEEPVAGRHEGIGWPDHSAQAKEIEGFKRHVNELKGKVESWKTAWSNQRDEIARLTARVDQLKEMIAK